jgi:hypothetical protein
VIALTVDAPSSATAATQLLPNQAVRAISGQPFTNCEGGMPKAEGPEEDRDEELNPAMERQYAERRRRQMGRRRVDEDTDQNVDGN